MITRITSALRALTGHDAPTDSAPTISVQSLNNMSDLLSDHEGIAHARIPKGQAADYFRRWQYGAATAIADGLIQVDWEVQSRDGGAWSQTTDHPLAALLRKPNPWMTTPELIYFLGLDWCFVGEHYWYIARDALGAPAQIWPLFGDMKALRSESEFLTGYELTVTTERGPVTRRFEPDEIVAFRLPNLRDPYTGFSPAQAAAGAIKLDDEMLKSRWAAFKHGIYPLAILVMSERDPRKRRELLDEFNTLYAGARESGRTVGISNSMELKLEGRSPQEMAFAESGAAVRDEITAMFRTPSMMLGITRDVPNRATAEAAEYIFGKWTIAPKLKLLQARLNHSLVIPHYGGDVRILFRSPIPKDREQDRKDEEMLLRNHVLTINEVRERRGLDPVLWGDKPLVQDNRSPLKTDQVKSEDALTTRLIAQRRQELHRRITRSLRKGWQSFFAKEKDSSADAAAHMRPYLIRALLQIGELNAELEGRPVPENWGGSHPEIQERLTALDSDVRAISDGKQAEALVPTFVARIMADT
jgi:HK97 family phage portal protein